MHRYLYHFSLKKSTQNFTIFLTVKAALPHNDLRESAEHSFVKIQQMLRVTPAMQAGIADHVWCMEEPLCSL